MLVEQRKRIRSLLALSDKNNDGFKRQYWGININLAKSKRGALLLSIYSHILKSFLWTVDFLLIVIERRGYLEVNCFLGLFSVIQ